MRTKEIGILSISKLTLYLAFAGIVYKFFTSTLFHLGGSIFTARFDILSFLMPAVTALSLFNLWNERDIRNNVVISGLIFSLYCTLVTIVSGLYSSTKLIYAIVDIIYWIIIVFVFYTAQNKGMLKKGMIILGNILFCAVLLAVIYSALTATQSGDYDKKDLLLNSVYYVIFLLPFVLMSDNGKIQVAAIFGTVIATFISNKRTALIVIVLVVAYWLMNRMRDVSVGKRLFRICFYIAVGILLFYVIQHMAGVFHISIFQRMEALNNGTDDGSGRTEIWMSTINQLKKEDFLTNLVGRGRRSVSVCPEYSTLSESHNDMLQFLFDYGIVGLIFYVGMCFMLVKKAFLMHRSRFKWCMPYVVSLIIFFLCSFVSMVMVYPYWFLGMAMFWGIVLGEFDRQRENSELPNLGGIYGK